MSTDNVSSSTITAVADTSASACHLLRIKDYSRTKLLLGNGMAARSPEFKAGGYTWCISYYPNGVSNEDADGISLLVQFITAKYDAIVVDANVRLTLLPHHGKPAPPTPHCVSFSRAFKQWRASGQRFITREELESSGYLVDDCFAVRCDVDVIRTVAVVDPVVPLLDLERMGLLCSCEDDLCKRRHASARTVQAASTSVSASAPVASTKHRRRQSRIKAAWLRLAS
ncbi:BTB/POZ and MATH domain-containing protein 3-like [Lolium perenne]|jgi:hypothetical protein|uniref:BTB/POZ and MATH domain-containing protein 3-like n=1 Tax=Lolium perenne TaxID=4522 RepID=UPI0021F58F97|nr:BTB/POZ and MATH domain-containing protein 3-like [Lolium perenne]